MFPSDFRKISHLILPIGLSTVALLSSGNAFAQAVLKPQAQAAARVENALSAAARNVGVQSCRPALDRLSALAIDGTRGNDVLLNWDRKRAPTSPLFALIGLEYANGGAAMSISAVPEADGSCSVAAERISMAPFTCQTVAQQELSGYQMIRLLSNFTVYKDDKDPTATVSLIDSGAGCLVIRRYVEFSWKPKGGASQ